MTRGVRDAAIRSPNRLPPGKEDCRDGTQHASARLVPVLRANGKLAFLLGAGCWLAAQGYFWLWWFTPSHNVWTLGFVLVTLVLVWVTVLPLYFIVIFFGARRVQGEVSLPSGSSIAMVVTKAPSEPAEVVKKTILAMLAQDMPRDVWLADEDPSPGMIAWCHEYNVRISTRKGVVAYHQKTWPRRTRCKEGNLAYFYDHVGYERYDFVAQLDADHVPDPSYLREVLKPFADPRVGYVSAPSICDANAHTSWSAQGRLHVEASMHGALQVGYNNGWAPLCIGSHYAVRTAALKDIGGLGPDLAEDHSTTLLFNANGWRGVHAVDAIAHGDGPNTFADLATQEFQWSRSLTTILLQYTPRSFGKLTPRLKFQFLFSQLWYPLFAGFMALMYLMPMAALTMGRPFVGVTFPQFLLHYAPVGLVLIGLAFGWRRTGVFRPIDAPILSWQGTAFLFARWPWALAGCLASMRDRLTGTVVEFRVTPKGAGAAAALPLRVLMPYALLSLGAALPALLVSDAGKASGFYIFSIFNAVVYGGLFGLIVWRHARETGLSLGLSGPGRTLGMQCSAALALLTLPAAAMGLHGKEGAQALALGIEEVKLAALTNSAPLQALKHEAGRVAERAAEPILDLTQTTAPVIATLLRSTDLFVVAILGLLTCAALLAMGFVRRDRNRARATGALQSVRHVHSASRLTPSISFQRPPTTLDPEGWAAQASNLDALRNPAFVGPVAPNETRPTHHRAAAPDERARKNRSGAEVMA